MGYARAITEDMNQEADHVVTLIEQLREMGISCPELIDASIESETNFKEILEAQIRASGEIEAQMKGLDDYVAKLNARKARLKALNETVRLGVAQAVERSGQKTVVTTFGTVTYARAGGSVRVIKESEVPADFFQTVLDQSELKRALTAWKKGYDKLDKIKDDEEREAAKAKYRLDHPPIPGAELTEGKLTLTIKRD